MWERSRKWLLLLLGHRLIGGRLVIEVCLREDGFSGVLQQQRLKPLQVRKACLDVRLALFSFELPEAVDGTEFFVLREEVHQTLVLLQHTVL